MAVRIGDLLVKERRISPDQLQQALSFQRQHGGRLGAHLVKLGYVRDRDLTEILSRQYGVPSIALSQFELDPEVLKLVPAETAWKYQVVPLCRSGATLTIAMTDPTNVFAMDDIKFMTGYHVEPVVASEAAVVDAIGRYYGANAPRAQGRPESALEMATRALEAMPRVDVEDVQVLEDFEEISVEALARQGEEAPVIRLVNVLLMSAISKGASDIHLEPYEKEFRIRFRIDGILYTVMSPPLRMRDAVTSRVKIMAKLDIAEKRLPQDGRIKIRFSDRGEAKDIDFRVSCLPTLFGEKIVLRLLDKARLMLDMTELGFEPGPLARFEAAIARPWGMVLVTGPTGSGKTNTLYSSIARINTPGRNILTVEDPVEFNIPGVNQVQVRETIGLTFAAALRSFLRQDPNIILVGEIRDTETAAIAVKAALTGHLVLSTLHTNDAPSSIGRLLNMGVEPFLVASSLNLVCAQRLVRRLCPRCRVADVQSPAALQHAGFSVVEAATVTPHRGAGCEACSGTGYRGRIGLYEVMEVTDDLREAILCGASAVELERTAMEHGMVTLRASGLQKVRDGITSVEEVLRETVR